jgi:hypothetical protein
MVENNGGCRKTPRGTGSRKADGTRRRTTADDNLAGIICELSSGARVPVALARRSDSPATGHERPRQILCQLACLPAAAVLEGLLAAWRRHRGAGQPADDTTIVVPRRP